MESRKSWRHEGGKFHSQRSQKFLSHSLRQPLVPGVGDSEVHDSEAGPRGRQVGWGGEYVKSMVYGGLDAIVTSFALVASVSGGNLPSGAVLVLGFANLIADGISMGFGDYLSSTTEENFKSNMKQQLEWDVDDNLHMQMGKMIEAYESKGMEREDAEKVVGILSKYNDLLIEQKMSLQDGLLPPDETESAWKNGLVTFVSFLCFGCTPVLAFVVLTPFTDSITLKFVSACVVTALALILLGIIKARISGERYLSSVFMVLTNGGLAAIAAYGISWILNNVFGIDD